MRYVEDYKDASGNVVAVTVEWEDGTVTVKWEDEDEGVITTGWSPVDLEDDEDPEEYADDLMLAEGYTPRIHRSFSDMLHEWRERSIR